MRGGSAAGQNALPTEGKVAPRGTGDGGIPCFLLRGFQLLRAAKNSFADREKWPPQGFPAPAGSRSPTAAADHHELS